MKDRRAVLKQLLNGRLTPDQAKETLTEIQPVCFLLDMGEGEYSVWGANGNHNNLTADQAQELTKGHTVKKIIFE